MNVAWYWLPFTNMVMPYVRPPQKPWFNMESFGICSFGVPEFPHSQENLQMMHFPDLPGLDGQTASRRPLLGLYGCGSLPISAMNTYPNMRLLLAVGFSDMNPGCSGRLDPSSQAAQALWLMTRTNMIVALAQTSPTKPSLTGCTMLYRHHWLCNRQWFDQALWPNLWRVASAEICRETANSMMVSSANAATIGTVADYNQPWLVMLHAD